MRWLGALVLAVVLTGCGSESGEETPAAATQSPETAEVTTAADPEEAFLRLTAAHLCTVQSSVFEDPADLAEAYEQAPAFPGITDEQVADFEQRVLDDPDFSDRLLEALAADCG